MRNSLICLIISFLAFSTAQAAKIEICGKLAEGELVRLKSDTATKAFAEGREYTFTDGGAWLAFPRDAKAMDLKVVFNNAEEKTFHLDVSPTKWDIQSIKGVPQRKVTPLAADEAEIKREQKDVGTALKSFDVYAKGWQNGFILPVDGVISGHFGNQRIFNGTPKSPHSGTDIAAPEGTPVKAAGDGKVLLSGGDYFYSGNVIIIDHGGGLQTIYAHLKETNVQKGDAVKKGQVIGLVGKTGRVTGPHLHWGASDNNVRFRPHALLEVNAQNCKIYQDEEKE